MEVNKLLDLAEEKSIKRSDEACYKMTDNLPNEDSAKELYEFASSFVNLGIRLMREEVENLWKVNQEDPKP